MARGPWSVRSWRWRPTAARSRAERGSPLPIRRSTPGPWRSWGGAVPLNANFYIERPTDGRAKDLILRRGVTVRVKGVGQSGKSSLLARLFQHARQNQLRPLYVDFDRLDDGQFDSLGAFLLYLAHWLSDQLRTNASPDSYWQGRLGPTDKLTRFLEHEVLAPSDGPVVLLLDKVDRLFRYELRDDFYGLIRSWHSNRAFDPDQVWEKLNLVLAYATDASELIKNIDMSPFNVGYEVELRDFDMDQFEELNRKHGGPVQSDRERDDLIELLQGHPFLMRKALYELVARGMTVRQLTDRAKDDDGPFGDHLHRHLLILHRAPDLLNAMKSVLEDRVCPDDLSFNRLRAAGLVCGPDRLHARPRCGLYQRYFGTHL